jgi:hypothetical protein
MVAVTVSEQREIAIARANEIRLARSDLKRDVRAGRRRFPDVLADPPDFALGMRVFDLVLCLPQVGRYTATRAFTKAGVSQSRTFGGMTPHERERLLERLGPRA